jgi:CheY-like chemotaxis protein
MNGILGLTDLVLETQLGSEQREYLRMVKSSAEAQLTILNDILDFSKIEAGKLGLDPLPFRLRHSLDDLLKPLILRAQEKGLKLACHVRPDVPDALHADLGRLRQILLNLVGNAIKFTEQGQVVVTVGRVGRLSEPGTRRVTCSEDIELHFSVRDTGIGIPAARQPAIFAPFEQADGSMARRYGGTGLGLTISARLVEMMGGHIWVQSKIGVGSTFHFTVRLAVQEDEPASSCEPAPTGQQSADSAGQRSLRILLAEDNLVNQKIVLGALGKGGHRISVANNGKEAVAAQQRETFDVILMDVQMPEMNGLEATAAIRQSEKGTGRHIPIIALTAHAMQGDRERFLEAGMDGYIAKPIRPQELFKAIAEQEPVLAPTVAEALPEQPTDQTLDRTMLLARVGGNVKLLRDVLSMFHRECPRLMGDLNEAISQRSAERIQQAAHTLKGTFGNLSAADAHAAALRLEQLSRQNDLADVGDGFAFLVQRVQVLDLAIAQLTTDLTS